MKIGVDTWSIHSQGWGDLQILEYLKGIGADVVHFASVYLLESQDEDHLRSIRQRADELGLGIEAGMNSICPTSTAYHAGREGPVVERVRTTLRLASALGAPVIKCFIGGLAERYGETPLGAHIEGAIATCRAVREQAMDLGITLAVENHGDLQSREVRTLIEEAGPEYVGSCFDAGNAVVLGEDPLTALDNLAPYVVTSHIRDSVVWPHPKGAAVQHVVMGQGNVGMTTLARRYRELCPQATFTVEVLTGSPPHVLRYLEPDYWRAFPEMPAWEFARFERLVRRGQPFVGTMVTIDRDDAVPPEYEAARIAQERYDLERSIRYCREELGLGE